MFYRNELFSDPSDAALGQRIKLLLTLGASVEILPNDGQSIVLRLWFGPHCDIAAHTSVG